MNREIKELITKVKNLKRKIHKNKKRKIINQQLINAYKCQKKIKNKAIIQAKQKQKKKMGRELTNSICDTKQFYDMYRKITKTAKTKLPPFVRIY